MILWRVANLLTTSVVIEDLGITLQARGGEDSSTQITDDAKRTSRSLQTLQQFKFISVTPVRPAAPTARPVIPPPIPIAVPISLPDQAMMDTIRQLESTIAQLTEKIRTQSTPDIPSALVFLPKDDKPSESDSSPEESATTTSTDTYSPSFKRRKRGRS